MATEQQLYLDGVSTGALTTTTAGSGDTPLTAIVGTASQFTVVSTSSHPPAMKFTQLASTSMSAYWTIPSRTSVFYRDYFKLDGPLTAATSRVILRMGAAAVRGMDLNLSSTGALRIFRADNTQVATTAAGAFFADTEYRREITLTTTTCLINLYLGDSPTPSITLQPTAQAAGGYGTSFDRISWGNLTGTTPTLEPMTVDSVLLDTTTTPGPLAGETVSEWQLGSIAMGGSESVAMPTLPVGGPGVTWTSLVFEDNFDGTTLDTTKWAAEEARDMNNVLTRTSNVSVHDGSVWLQLSSPTEGANIMSDPTYIPGVNKYLFAIGDYLEARVWFPGSDTTTEQMYNWPAFWTASVMPTWPTNGEIDIVEGLGGDPTINYHYGYDTAAGHFINNSAPRAGDWNNDYHVFACYRRPNRVDIYWDGVLNRTMNTNDLGGAEAVYVTVGASGSRTNILGEAGAVRVDYVRAWRAPVTDPRLPNWPYTFSATAASNTTATVSWRAATVPLGGTAVTGYRIYDGTTLLGTFGNVTSGTLTGLSGGVPYVLGVKAVNAAGESVQTSPTVPLTLTYTVPALPAGIISRRPSITSAEVQSATTLVVNRPTGAATGDLLVCAYGGGPITTPTISGTGWVLRGSVAQSVNCAVWTKYITDITTEPASYTVTGNTSAGRISATINCYTGTNQFSTLDAPVVTATKADGPTQASFIDLPSITTITPKAVLYAACSANFATGFYLMEPGTMARTWQSTGTGRRLAVADEYRGTAGATGTRTFTQSASGTAELNAVMFAIKPAPVALGGLITRKASTLAETASATTLACDKPPNLADGDVLVAGLVVTGGTPTGPAGWTLMQMQTPGAGAVTSSLWLKVITTASSEPTTYTWTSSTAAGRMSVGITAYDGVNNVTPQDVTAQGGTVLSTVGSSNTLSGLTTVTPGAVLVGVGGLDSAAVVSITAPSQMNEIWHSQGTGRQAVFSDELRTTAGATGSRTWTQPPPNTLQMQASLGALRPD